MQAGLPSVTEPAESTNVWSSVMSAARPARSRALMQSLNAATTVWGDSVTIGHGTNTVESSTVFKGTSQQGPLGNDAGMTRIGRVLGIIGGLGAGWIFAMSTPLLLD